MIIENPDVFKSWLTSILEPLCDADPAALAKYVYALVKKDKPVEELREVMVDQLDVFLQQETKPFVEMLFKSLETHDYLKPKEGGDKPPSPSPADLEPEKAPETEQPVLAPAPNGSVRSPPRHRVVLSRPAARAAPATLPTALPPAPAPAPAPPVQRTVHTEQTLVKVLPLTELLEEPIDQPPRRRDRRNDSLRDKEDRRRRRSRSNERRMRPRRHQHYEDRRRVTSRSPSPRRYRNRSPPTDRLPSRSRSRSPVPVRDRDHERERERVRIPRDLERDRMSRDREHRDRISRSRDRERSRERSRDRSRGSTSPRDLRVEHNDGYKRRCRDFDEKGYCMRGDLCSWDHGADPVVLEDAALSTVLQVPEYNPLAPDIWMGAPFAAYPPQHPHPPRELIPIPRVRQCAPAAPLAPLPPRHPPPNKKNFDYNRIGMPRPPLPANAANCSLEVKKVPRGMNDITHLNNHFSKFGKIVNIQVCYESDPEAALITFSTPTEANVAYKSTEAVLNNRFIKVFWHNPDQNKQENLAPGGQQPPKPAERPNSQHPMSHNKVLINRDNIKATADIKQANIEKPAERPNSQHPMSHNKVLINRDNIKATADIKQANIEKEKEMLNGIEPKKEMLKPVTVDKGKRVMEMYKRGQELLQTQLHQQRLLIQKLESGNVTGAQKTALMEAINSAQEGIEKLRKELVAYNGTIKQLQDDTVARSMAQLHLNQVNAKRPKTREEAQKEILDAELDMFTKQNEGQDVTELAKKIAELRKQMSIQFPTHTMIRRPHSRGGRFNTATRYTRGGVNKVYTMNQSVDHRPRALLISGFETDELDSLYKHFSQFGEVSSKEVDLAVPQLVLQYKARAHAEQAILHGRHYNDRTLSITWVMNAKSALSSNAVELRAPPTHNGDVTANENKEEIHHHITDTSQLFEEEDDDETEEDRSWRR